MRKVLVLEHISLDGVIQGPGGPDEDTSGGFSQGGWIHDYSDPLLSQEVRRQMDSDLDLLLGRQTYDIWAPYWPLHGDIWPNANTAVKYVASRTLTEGSWSRTVVLAEDLESQVQALRHQPGPDLHVWGSSQLVQTLLRCDLVDGLWLMVYPLVLGHGKRLFSGGVPGEKFVLQDSKTTTKGVQITTYGRMSQRL